MRCDRLLMGPESLEASILQDPGMNLSEGISAGFVKVSGVSCCSYILRSLPAVLKNCLFSGLVYPVRDNNNSVNQKLFVKHTLFSFRTFPIFAKWEGMNFSAWKINMTFLKNQVQEFQHLDALTFQYKTKWILAHNISYNVKSNTNYFPSLGLKFINVFWSGWKSSPK